jgi:hypothetical protein
MRQAVLSCIRGLVSNRISVQLIFSRFSHETDDARWVANDDDSETADGETVAVDYHLGEEIWRMLHAHNNSLRRIDGLLYESEAQEERIESLLTLNRYAEDFASKAHRVPMEHWSDVLARISSDDCNYFVTKLARQAVRGGAGSSGNERTSPGRDKRMHMNTHHGLAGRLIAWWFSCGRGARPKSCTRRSAVQFSWRLR